MVLCKLLQDMANDIIQSNCTERQTSEKGNLFPAFSSWWAARMCAHLQNKQLQRQPPESQPQSPSHTHSPHSDVLFHDLFKSWGPWALRKRSFCPNKHNFLFRLQPVLLTGQIATPTMSAHSTLCGKEWREVETWHLGNTYRVAGTVHTQKHPHWSHKHISLSLKWDITPILEIKKLSLTGEVNSTRSYNYSGT